MIDELTSCDSFAERKSTKRNSGFSRRVMLQKSACGFGYLALADLIARQSATATAAEALRSSGLHHPARAKRVILLFMHGGPSQVDTFDYKPLLQRDDGKTFGGTIPAQIDATPTLLASPWKFKQHGQSGLWVSELMPEVAKVVDRLCVVRSVHSRGQSHGQAVSMLHTGSDNLIRPSVGSWSAMDWGLRIRICLRSWLSVLRRAMVVRAITAPRFCLLSIKRW